MYSSSKFNQETISYTLQSFVPESEKDERYWTRRLQNNVAARRSREARRLKDNQVALRTAFLEEENKELRRRVAAAREANDAREAELREMRRRLDAATTAAKPVPTAT